VWTYPGGILVTFSQFNTNGAPADLRHSTMEVRGTEGTLYLTWNGYEVVPEKVTEMEFPALSPLDRSLERQWESRRKTMIEARKNEGKDSTALHARNFLDCVRSRRPCNCDIETGHRSTTTTLIANIALKTRSYLEWDRRAEQFTNHQAANKFLSYAYRAPYSLPEV
jgi:predicted dehydrogenase